MAPKRGTDWFVRIHRTYEEIEPWVRNLSDKAAKLIVYQHDSDEEVNRTHCHLMIIGYTTSDETMKTQLTKVLGVRLKGQKDWAWDPVVRNESAAIQYMSKRDLQPKYVLNYEDSYVAECSAKYEPPDEYRKEEKHSRKLIPEKPEITKKRRNDYIEEMIQALKDEHPMYHYVDGFKYKWCAEEIKYIIINILNKNSEIYNRYKIRDYYDTLMGRLCPERFVGKIQSIVGFLESGLSHG